MSASRLLKCEKCGKPLGYINVKAKSYLEAKPDLDNVVISGDCLTCRGRTGFYHRNF